MTANDLVFSPPVRSKPTSAVRRPGSVPNAVLPGLARLSFLILSPSSLLRPNQVLRHPYGQLSEAAPSRLEATQGSEAQVARRARALRTAWVLFFVLGVPLAFMAALGPLAYSGIYIEPLRQFWQPWPPDVLKG